MDTITTVGLDIAKSVFQVHSADKDGKLVVVRKKLRRGQVIKFFSTLAPCLVGMEACDSGTTGRANCGHRGMTCG